MKRFAGLLIILSVVIISLSVVSTQSLGQQQQQNESGDKKVDIQLTQQTWIENTNFEPEKDKVVINFQTDSLSPVDVTVTDSPPLSAVDGSINVVPKEFTISGGGTTIVTESTNFEGCQAISVKTQYQRGTTIIPSDKCSNTTEIIDRDSRWSDVLILLSVLTLTIILSVISAGFIHRKVTKSETIGVMDYINNNRLFK